nr:hypothetical protein CFP56_57487 [Quercus suber]
MGHGETHAGETHLPPPTSNPLAAAGPLFTDATFHVEFSQSATSLRNIRFCASTILLQIVTFNSMILLLLIGSKPLAVPIEEFAFPGPPCNVCQGNLDMKRTKMWDH